MASGTITVHPAALLADHAYAAITNANNPIGATSSATTYAQISMTTGSGAETYAYYSFDLSDIPADAEITSISCRAKGYVGSTNTSYVSSRQMQMFAGTTPKGSATNLTTTASAVNMTVGTWTRQELNDCRIRLYAKRGTSGTTTSRYLRFYGSDLTVNYTYQEEQYTITTTAVGDGSISPSGETVVLGGATFVATIEPSDDYTLMELTLDGADVLEQAEQSGNVYVYTLTNVRADHDIIAVFGVESCSSILDMMITDRTSDLDIYGYTDINRIADAVMCVSAEVSKYGYYAQSADLKDDWIMTDYFYLSDADELMGAIVRIRDNMATRLASDFPPSFEDLDFDGANKIEQFLVDIDALMQEIIKTYPQCGMYEAGEL